MHDYAPLVELLAVAEVVTREMINRPFGHAVNSVLSWSLVSGTRGRTADRRLACWEHYPLRLHVSRVGVFESRDSCIYKLVKSIVSSQQTKTTCVVCLLTWFAWV